MIPRSRSILSIVLLGLLASCSVMHKQISSYRTSYTVIDTTLAKDGKLEQMLLPYKRSMDTAMNVVIGYSEAPMSKAQPECTLGNFMADAQLVLARRSDAATQVSIMNYGGIRLPYISPGPLTKGKIYELMPFDNKLTIVEIPGKVLRQFCDHMAAYGGWPVAGISFRIKDKKAIDITVRGQPLNDQLVYHTAVSDYIANGGDNCAFLADCRKTYINIFVRDMLIDYLAELNGKGQKLNVKIEKRVSYAE
jgi:2',3'-cyclic-nucleotide 2'-phosphodiesterase (5'-nucleotidase family)